MKVPDVSSQKPEKSSFAMSSISGQSRSRITLGATFLYRSQDKANPGKEFGRGIMIQLLKHAQRSGLWVCQYFVIP